MFSTYHEIIEKFQQAKVLVVGDLILDSYLNGVASRLSPEAPVPVVCIRSRTDVLGGAGNIAVNLKALGSAVTLLSTVGDDDDGGKSIQLLENMGVDCSLIVRDSRRKTMVKTRVISQSQILSRFDYGSELPINGETEERLIEFLRSQYQNFDIIVIGDYYRGILTARLIEEIGNQQQKYQKFLAVDSKDLPAFKALQPALIKPNYAEATRLLNIPCQNDYREDQFFDRGRQLFEVTGASVVALTLDAEGAMVFEKGEYAYRSFAHPVAAPKVVGAGDTFISTMALALAAGADLPVATELATAASAIAVQKETTAPCDQAELISFFSLKQKYIDQSKELKKLCEIYRAQGKKIVFTNGCFDILHSGHISYLHRSKELGDILIVGINSDDSIKRLKGDDRPINTLADRVEVLCGLSAIDHVIAFGDDGADSPIEELRAAQPDIYAKGGDYTRETLPEAAIVEELGGRIEFVPLVPDHSTTQIIRRIHKRKTDTVKVDA